MRWSSRVPIPLLVLIFVLFASSNGNEEMTKECLSQASFSDCMVFNRCCDVKCAQGVSKANPFFFKQSHSCMSILGQISVDHTNCFCETQTSSAESSMEYSKRRWAKMDIVAGVLLIFIVDMLLLSFTF
ncbi:hypothetical protein QR680_005429 [Steinernema hermaphroditum]|uniref:Uncharacterized protein n=1 Tax=Steinernema hermaphroditum TaxID=289476 RepID=A0AA39HUB9_9BILA|nr:hypothetical protein QR680_005429 [Steinernema hermaphroditum]